MASAVNRAVTGQERRQSGATGARTAAGPALTALAHARGGSIEEIDFLEEGLSPGVERGEWGGVW